MTTMQGLTGGGRLPRVALETTLLLHGVPAAAAMPLARELDALIRGRGCEPALCGVFRGQPTTQLLAAQLDEMLRWPNPIPKLNSSNFGISTFRGEHGATTVSTTMEMAARAGIGVFATGGIGGVHRNFGVQLDISADLAALARFPVAVVCAGCKSILDVHATREALETLGVCVVGFRTSEFPAFYQRGVTPAVTVDARFDDVAELGRFARHETARTRRGLLICNPISQADEISESDWRSWHAAAEAKVNVPSSSAAGRGATPARLAALHDVSGGATLRANIALVKANADLAAQVALVMAQ